MRLNLLKLHLLAFSILAFSSINAQNDDAKYLKNFDEKRAIEAAKAENISAEQLPAFIKKLKQHHINKAKSLEHPVDHLYLGVKSSGQQYNSVQMNPFCPNAGFQNNNFGGWTGGWYDENNLTPWTSSPWSGSSGWTTSAFATGTTNCSLSTANAQHT